MTTDIATPAATRTVAIWAEGNKLDLDSSGHGLQIMGRSATNDMPWPANPKDLRHFAAETRDHVMVMGRNTYNSLPPHVKYSSTGTLARPLIVLTTDPIWAFQQTVEAKRNRVTAYFGGYGRPENTLAFVRSHFPNKSIAVIGGPKVIELFEPFYDKLIVTQVRNPADYRGWYGDVPAPFQGKRFGDLFGRRGHMYPSVRTLDADTVVYTYSS